MMRQRIYFAADTSIAPSVDAVQENEAQIPGDTHDFSNLTVLKLRWSSTQIGTHYHATNPALSMESAILYSVRDEK